MNNINDEEIFHIIEQAKATLDDTKFLIENNRLSIAVNRLYYSVFYILSALSSKYNFKTSKHTQLLGWFNKNFVSTNKIKKEYGKFVHNIFDQRTKADYDFYSNFDIIQVKQMYNEVNEFMNDVIRIINE